jgi:predicted neuraminidase
MKHAARIVLFTAASVSVRAEGQLVRSEFIYESAPFPACHASTIVETPSGLVSAWFGGTAEKNPDVGIWLSRHKGGSWNVPVEVANGVQSPDATGKPVRHPTWNPVLFQPKDAPLMLFYKVGPSPSSWWGMLTTSKDGGHTWATPQRLPDGILGPVKNKPVQLANGDILCGSSAETSGLLDKWTVHFERTSDLGKTWHRIEPADDGTTVQAIQPSILFLGGDKLLALGRTRQHKVFQISSDDSGKTWGALSLGMLPNPNSGTDAVTLKDGRHLIVYNHVGGDPLRWGGKRTPLNVAISTDGKAWRAATVLENTPGEYSYPAVIQSADGMVHITYTWNRKKVRHAVIDPSKLTARDFENGDWPK